MRKGSQTASSLGLVSSRIVETLNVKVCPNKAVNCLGKFIPTRINQEVCLRCANKLNLNLAPPVPTGKPFYRIKLSTISCKNNL